MAIPIPESRLETAPTMVEEPDRSRRDAASPRRASPPLPGHSFSWKASTWRLSRMTQRL
jgi:hypothetical protein